MSTRRSRARRKASGPFAFLKRFVKFCFVTVCVLSAIGLGYVGASGFKHLQDLPDITLVERYEPIEAIQIFDKNEHLICTVEGDEDRRVVPLTQIASQMQQSILAAEDHHFYEHHGINVMSIVRALFANLQAHKVVEGGSTITQQLVKNLFFTDAQRTLDRKLKEAYMAYQIERRYPKDRILEMYLNQVYFGNNAYGIERAASRYFDRSAAGLDLAQSAFLAGLVKAPSELGSTSNRAAARARQHEILDKMVDYGYITPEQSAKAKKEKLVFKKGTNPLQKYPYYVSYVLELLHDKFSQSELRRQGLRVYTNLDPMAQELAEKTLEQAAQKTPKGVSQLALVSVNVADGAVIAMVGGVGNYWKHQFNRATNPHTAGSSFKPYVYLTALVKGMMAPDSLVEDTPLVIHQPWGLPDYCPKNFDKRFMGKIPLRKALALSRNVCSVRLAQMVGIDSVIETAREAGITTKLEPNLSLALGSSAVTPLDQAGSYATFARMGVTIKPEVLRRIEDNRGQVLQVFEPKTDRAFNVEPVARLVDMMQDVVKYGTGTQAKLTDRPVAGKTGTADAGKDIWFIGFTTDLCTSVWGGNDQDLPIPGQHVTGGDVMAKIWRQYMAAYYEAHPMPPGNFVAPSYNKDELKNNANSKLAKDNNPAHSATTSEYKALDEPGAGLQPPNEAVSVRSTPEETITITPSASEHTGALEQPKTSAATEAPPPSGQVVPTQSATPTPVVAPSHSQSSSSTNVPLPAESFVVKSAPASNSPATPAPLPAPAQTPKSGGVVPLPADSFNATPPSAPARLYPYTPSPTLHPAQPQ